uniref:Putative ATPase n=1 Tax=Trypanosoma vivax (strain Y486) TaxID=1055687 RepID=G0U7N1_TRYVY|nr:putative ATPase [Trypanosoma vivax Y486]
MLTVVLWEMVVSQKDNAGRLLKDLLFVTLEVRSSREEFVMIIDWLARQPCGKRSRNISLAPVSVLEEKHAVLREGEAQPIVEERLRNSDFVPGFGRHLARFEGTWLWICRCIDTSKQYRSSAHTDREHEVLEIMFLTRDRSVVQRFMEQVYASWKEQAKDTVSLYVPGGWGTQWEFLSKRLRRPLSTLHLPQTTTSIVEDIRFFLRSRDLYMTLGIPWRRGYLFEGPPGTGKTSFILAIASELSLPIYLLSLHSRELDDVALTKLINSVPPRSLLVIEDLERAIRWREEALHTKGTEGCPTEAATTSNAELDGARVAGAVSLSALLNAIDGIASSEGRVLVVTTNDSAQLPSRQALLRPGRIDQHVTFQPLDHPSRRAMLQSFNRLVKQVLPEKDSPRAGESDEFLTHLGTTPAKLQNDLLNALYKNKPA